MLYILGELDDDDVEWLLASGQRLHLTAGEVLIHEAQEPSALFLVLDGALSVSATRAGDVELARMGRGTLAGEMSFVDGLPPASTVRALEDTVVLAVPRNLLADRLRADAVFAARFYRAIARLLSQRLRAGNLARVGGRAPLLDETIQEPDEIDVIGLETAFLAGRRFDRILTRLLGT